MLEAKLEAPSVESPSLGAVSEELKPDDNENSAVEGSSEWRQEVAARLNRYQARRKPRPPRYPSLQLRFEEEVLPSSTTVSSEPAVFSHAATFSNQALALDRFAQEVSETIESSVCAPPEAGSEIAAESLRSSTVAPSAQSRAQITAKIIEFPRSWMPPVAPMDELAEPVIDRPRILEAPEVVPPPPALGGITIEPAAQPASEKRPGIDTPLQSAPPGRRIFSAAVDDAIIAAACALFGFIFWKMTAIRPPRIQILGLAAGLASLFWATYQYLLVVYSGSTPGLRLAKLEVARFDGSPASRRLRRWRVLASFLSAGSLGLGYVWAFLDEDVLCWHDRITHTYLAPREQKTAPRPGP